MFVAGQVAQGIPWGIFQTLAVTYAADICPLTLRHFMTAWVCSFEALSTSITWLTSLDSQLGQHVLGYWPVDIRWDHERLDQPPGRVVLPYPFCDTMGT